MKMSEAWDLARTCVGYAQRRQKQCYRQPFKWVIECSFLNLLRRQERPPISLHDHFMARFKWIPTLPGFVELTSHRRRIFWWLSTGSEDAQQRLQMNTGHQKKKRKTFKPMAEQEARNTQGTGLEQGVSEELAPKQGVEDTSALEAEAREPELWTYSPHNWRERVRYQQLNSLP